VVEERRRREWLGGEVESLALEGSHPLRVTDFESAFAEPSRLILLVPDDELAVVLDLDGNRDRLDSEDRPRTQPIVLFLLRGGDGQQALATRAHSLEGWLRGKDTDPEALAQIDVSKERADFEAQGHGSPERWLERWRGGELPQTSTNLRTAYWAMLLEAP
jgi:hypothetical protein